MRWYLSARINAESILKEHLTEAGCRYLTVSIIGESGNALFVLNSSRLSYGYVLVAGLNSETDQQTTEADGER